MFGVRYFAPRYFPSRYYPNGSDVVQVVHPCPAIEIAVTQRTVTEIQVAQRQVTEINVDCP